MKNENGQTIPQKLAAYIIEMDWKKRFTIKALAGCLQYEYSIQNQANNVRTATHLMNCIERQDGSSWDANFVINDKRPCRKCVLEKKACRLRDARGT